MGFWAGRHWRPDAALWRKDWSIKPAGEAYRELVFRQWWTDEKLTTDDRGDAKVRGFLGGYRVIAEHDGREATHELTLTAEGTQVTLTLGRGSADPE